MSSADWGRLTVPGEVNVLAWTPILIERINRRWGVALGPEGRFYRVMVPAGINVGDALPARTVRGWVRCTLAAAAACLLLLAAVTILMRKTDAGRYALVTLRVAQPMLETAPSGSIRIEHAQVMLAVNKRGTVAAVRPQEKDTVELVGLRVEEAIKCTAGQLTMVEVRPRRNSPEDETAYLEARIRTALPECEPPIEVEVGPPADDDEIAAVQDGDDGSGHHGQSHQPSPQGPGGGKGKGKGKGD